VGPAKEMLTSLSDVSAFHRTGLKVHPYTFRGSTVASKREALSTVEANGKSLGQNIVEEIRHLVEFGIDGGFTDYPDLWNEAVGGNKRSAPSSQP
jgi:glycerophosphoryl diester phosphodiesterase